ncbi:glycosyltransferase family 61 protein [Natronorubrum sulfidifaciens]|uniref:Capsular polysaccharide biosynthesis protein-like protein n=1 Tax=Natronorubrum sulfidifaciens JCM 14089 TaxID=1230460 RepID=L9W7Z6_9EURY|nr:glycosyltransferase family 61 protein [Natronorubrum sulfidifaciens]ELY45594.1 capsular polysaccharide biosynthesis protein-like protein [Natronorubrum sulfidifaciens JCM 14089]
MNGGLVNDAKDWYAEHGAVSLLKRGLEYGYETKSQPIVRKAIARGFDEVVIDSQQLKSEYATRSWDLDDGTDNLTPRVSKELAPLEGQTGLEHNYYPEFAFEAPFVAEVDNVTVAGRGAVAIANDGGFIAEPTHSRSQSVTGRVGREISLAITESPLQLGSKRRRKKLSGRGPSIETAAILHSQWLSRQSVNYFHWMVEHLLKVRGIAHYENVTGADVTLLIPPNPPSFVTESIELLGYDEKKIKEWNGRAVDIDRLVVPSFPDPTPNALGWLRERMFNAVSTDLSGPDWIYISRQNEHKRRVHNYSEIEALLKQYGVEIVHCEDLSLREEIQIFNGASSVISPHGAGLTATIWGGNLSVVEIFNQVVKAPYYVLAYILGHEYTAMAAPPAETMNEKRERNMDVDLNEFEQILQEMTEC